MIISFSQLGRHGRLGNQLFQVASTLGLAEKYGATAVFPQWAYEQYFENVLEHGNEQSVHVSERYFHHYDWELRGEWDVDISGYLQSEKYFGLQKLRLKQSFVEECKRELDIFSNETICIQVRRGDYVENPNYFQLRPEFYLDAMITHLPNWREMNILVISDDVEYCRVHFGCLPNVYFTEWNSDIKDMALASLCDHFIISNSTFGWWCAYLGEKPHSKIVHSGHLFRGHLAKTHNIKDYRPERWIEYKKDTYKIDLKDITFTIPVYMDHETRKGNLELILCMLQTSFDSNYIIMEQGGRKLEHMAQWAKYVRFKEQQFHRTKMLNDMCGIADTPYIANWDCDVIISPVGMFLAVEELRHGADMVFPYDGRFGRMPRPQWFGQLQKSLDIGIVRNSPLKGMEPDHNSVGGAVLWNKESFIDGGMENEYFVSFGPEDGERNDRFNTLGYDVRRVKGALYHMNHYVGPNSSPANPYFDANVREQQKVHNMTREQLLSYVDTWPWRHPYTTRYYHRISQSAIISSEIVMGALPFKPKHIIDVGCGVGEWDRGIGEYFGIDYHVRKEDLLIPIENFTECDLNRSFPLIATTFSEKFDLCLCLEVAEHLKSSRAEPLIEYLCSLSEYVLFSAAIPFQGGVGHINEQWQSWWAAEFAKYGYRASLKQLNIRNNPLIDLWYRQNIVLYQKGAKGRVEDFVLPEYYLQIVKGLKNG